MHDHGHTALRVPTDARFPEDDFTKAALLERTHDAAHERAKHTFLAVLGALVVFGIFSRVFGRCA